MSHFYRSRDLEPLWELIHMPHSGLVLQVLPAEMGPYLNCKATR